MKEKNEVIYVLLDSNVYYENRFLETPSGQWLREFAEDQNIRIILPLIVEMESRSHLRADLEKHLLHLGESIRFLQTLDHVPFAFLEIFGFYQEDYKQYMTSKIDIFFSSKFFLKVNNFNSHSHMVFDDYFKGEGCFKSEKTEFFWIVDQQNDLLRC